jgi:hypothetical protein
MKFGPDDDSTLDSQKAKAISDKAEKIKDKLLSQYKELEKMRHGGAQEHVPVSRADGLWPFLLIRSFPGDIGARPMQIPVHLNSPDIILTVNNPSYLPTIIGRDEIGTFLQNNKIIPRWSGARPDTAVWVHVWNLGRAPAHGVRVRAWCFGGFIGGRQFDLGGRTSSTSHLIVRVGSLDPGLILPPVRIHATAECMSDVAAPVRDPSQDRHTARITV